MIKQDKLKFIL